MASHHKTQCFRWLHQYGECVRIGLLEKITFQKITLGTLNSLPERKASRDPRILLSLKTFSTTLSNNPPLSYYVSLAWKKAAEKLQQQNMYRGNRQHKRNASSIRQLIHKSPWEMKSFISGLRYTSLYNGISFPKHTLPHRSAMRSP